MTNLSEMPGHFIRFKRLHEAAMEPLKATDGAGAFDLYAAERGEIWPGQIVSVSTGLAIELPVTRVGLLFARSGIAVKEGVCLANGVGVIDSDYRGEVKVPLFMPKGDRTLSWRWEVGSRIAQLIVLPVCYAAFVEVANLSETVRGEGGFGSTGMLAENTEVE